MTNQQRSLRQVAAFLMATFVVASQAFAQNPSTGNLPAPEFEGVTEWLNSDPLKLADLRGKVVLVHFWTFGCSNCIHDHDKYLAWEKRYAKNKNFVMIGIHTPETDAERNLENVRQKVKETGFTHATAVDNEGKMWKAWQNRWWPSMALIDKYGNARYAWEGELAWKGATGPAIMTKKIDELLREKYPKPVASASDEAFAE